MIASKLPNIETNLFSDFSKLALEHSSIDFSTSISDINCPKDLQDAIIGAVKEPNHHYSPMNGLPELRKTISALMLGKYGKEYDPENEITITAGANSAINTSITTIVREDEEVIIMEPTYQAYTPLVKINGGKPVYVKLNSTDYAIDWDEMNRAITARTRMIIINSPHNPTGQVFSHEDMEKLSRLVSGSKITILSDEVFGFLTFDKKHSSIAQYPELAKRSIIVGSFGKIFQLNGWNTGYVLAPKELTKEFRKINQFLGNPGNNVIQHALAKYLNVQTDVDNINQIYHKKLTFFQEQISKTKYKIKPVFGSYYLVLDYSEISDEKDVVFAQRLITEYGISTMPMSLFYHDKTDRKQLRLCFAKPLALIEKAIDILLTVKPAETEE